MAHTATVTAKTGPDVTNTAVAHPNVKGVTFDLRANVLRLDLDPPPVTEPTKPVHTTELFKEYDLAGKTTVTCTITAGQYAFVVS